MKNYNSHRAVLGVPSLSFYSIVTNPTKIQILLGSSSFLPFFFQEVNFFFFFAVYFYFKIISKVLKSCKDGTTFFPETFQSKVEDLCPNTPEHSVYISFGMGILFYKASSNIKIKRLLMIYYNNLKPRLSKQEFLKCFFLQKLTSSKVHLDY